MVTRGEVHALVGENGAGKSTLMKILSGDVLPDSGAMAVGGDRVSFRSPHDAQSAGISMIQQELSYVGALSVAENLVLGRLPSHGFGILDRRAMRDHARSLVSRAGLDIDVTRRMSTLSQIEKQLVEILKATDRQARVIVMDEPTSSLTSAEVQLLFGIIDQLRATDVSVVYISHHLDEIFSIADRVTVLRDGSRISTREVSEVTHDSLVREMVGGVVETARRVDASAENTAVCRLTSLTLPGGVSDVSLEVRAGGSTRFMGFWAPDRSAWPERFTGSSRTTKASSRYRGKPSTYEPLVRRSLMASVSSPPIARPRVSSPSDRYATTSPTPRCGH
jgi:ribose transport system ATP-binding protein